LRSRRINSHALRAALKYFSPPKTRAASASARTAKAVGTMVGVPCGAKKARPCQSKLYPQHAPLHPASCASSTASNNSRAARSDSDVPVARKRESAANANNAVPFEFRPAGTRASLRKSKGARLNACVHASRATRDCLKGVD
jgi:hypothetical protein